MEQPEEKDLYQIGTVSHIRQILRLSSGSARQLQLQNLAAIILNFILVVLPQLVLEDPNLRAENLVPLRANQLVPDLALHLVFKAQDAALPGQQAVQLPQADEGGQLLQDFLLVRVPQGDRITAARFWSCTWRKRRKSIF